MTSKALTRKALTKALTASNMQVHLQAGDRVAVVGTGKLGILIAQALAAVGGVRVTAFGRRDANFRPSPP
jgi:D-arabinose 1-dehydrogenase-like Zn-dependent alcohol dehydrogenase